MTTSEILESRVGWMERALRAEQVLEQNMPFSELLKEAQRRGLLPPEEMNTPLINTPLGLLPVNAEGMQRLSNALAQAKVALEEISKGLSEAQEMLDVLRMML